MREFDSEYYFEKIETYEHKNLFFNTTYIWDVLKNVRFYVDGIMNRNDELDYTDVKFGNHVAVEGKCIIGRNTVIHSGAVIEGPAIIGKNCTIMSHALIRPYSVIGDNCTIGHAAEVKNSILMNNAKVQSFTFVGDSIIGDSARVGSGTILANRRFDQKNIKFKIGDKLIDSELDYLGCILGDQSRLGANCTTLPGTTIGMHTWTNSMIKLKGFVQRDKMIDPKDGIIEMKDKERVELK